jgi:hypothetical protein
MSPLKKDDFLGAQLHAWFAGRSGARFEVGQRHTASQGF